MLTFLRLQAVLMSVFATLVARIEARRSFIPTSRMSLVSARGVTFIEYALLAAVAVFVAWIFRTQLSSIFTTFLGRLGVSIGNYSTTG